MTETAHILEEIRSIRTDQSAQLSKMTDLCTEIRELVIEHRHTQKDYEALNSRVFKNESDLRGLQMESATNKPIMDIAKRMYYSQWITIAAAGGGTVAMNWTKLFGA